MLENEYAATILILTSGSVGLIWALIQYSIIAKISIRGGATGESTSLTGGNDEETLKRLEEIYTAIVEGAESFLRAEYRVCFIFIMVFSVIILVLVSWGTGWDAARGFFYCH